MAETREDEIRQLVDRVYRGSRAVFSPRGSVYWAISILPRTQCRMRLPPHSCVGLETARPRTLAHGSFPLPDSKRSTRCDVAPDLMLRSRELQKQLETQTSGVSLLIYWNTGACSHCPYIRPLLSQAYCSWHNKYGSRDKNAREATPRCEY